MHLLNATRMVAGYTLGRRADGRESVVVVVKGTFTLPSRRGEKVEIAQKQLPLVEADTFTGEPGLSAPKHESDYAPFKPGCDVLLAGSAYAPGNQPTARVTVTLRVGAMRKSFDVVGDRVWRNGLTGLKPGPPKPFSIMPISYDTAFGGTDRLGTDASDHRTNLLNHAGRGYHSQPDPRLEGMPLPNTEETGNPVVSPNGQYRPMAFGPIGRAWQPRAALAGTYDENWLNNVFPFLPPDFDDHYYQAAPQDQQIDYPKGGEECELVNLTKQGRTAFNLPSIDIPIVFFLKDYQRRDTAGTLDTIIIEPDELRLILCWRSSLPLRRNIFEVAQALVGKMPRGWYRARELGKTHYSGLSEMIRRKAESRREFGAAQSEPAAEEPPAVLEDEPEDEEEEE